MSKYWNARRIARVRAREKSREKNLSEASIRRCEHERTHTPGDPRKNTSLIFDALGLPLRRRMLARIRREGALSLSKLADPFHLTLPTAQFHLNILARVGLVRTHKQGRVRMIVFNKAVFKEFVLTLSSQKFEFDV